MSARSGVFTKYVIEFVDTKFKVSNDISAGDFLLDADVTVTMGRDTAGTTFTITLYNLPRDKLDALDDALDAAKTAKGYPSVNVRLGYFETNVLQVVDGIYEKVESSVAADSTTGQNRLVTKITGKEKALRACTDAKYSCSLSDDDALTAEQAARSVLSEVGSAANKKAHPGIDNLLPDRTVQVTGELQGKADTTFSNNSVLTVLSEIAAKAKAELLIVDGKVHLGAPIKYDPTPPGAAGVTFDPSVNLAGFTKVKANVKPKTADGKTPGADQANAPADATIRAFTFTVLGDPTIRPGQKVSVTGVKGYTFATEFRINSVTHLLSGTAGYLCNGDAVDAANATSARDAVKASAAGGAQDVASAIKSEAGKNPVVEVASVKGAADKSKYPYQADLYYGQTRGDEQQPSIETAIVPTDDCHVYRHKPIASPFAWRKCGLVTPVYPVMKALVTHNAGLATDGIVTGYIWSKLPDLPPPPNEPGDWWLCLPIDFDLTASGLPADQTKSTEGEGKPYDWKKFNWSNFDKTKAANDLTAGNGCRVIELKGLKITVGADALKEIGTRPTEGAAEECTIAHSSGAVITIKKSEIDVDTGSGPKLTLSSSGITLTDGTLNVQLANGKLAIG